MPDYLLTFFATTASLAVVLAFALVLDARAEARRWSKGEHPRWLRTTSGVMMLIEIAAIAITFVVSMGQLIDNADDRGMAVLAASTLALAFGMLGLGVLGGPLTVAFMKDPTGTDWD